MSNPMSTYIADSNYPVQNSFQVGDPSPIDGMNLQSDLGTSVNPYNQLSPLMATPVNATPPKVGNVDDALNAPDRNARNDRFPKTADDDRAPTAGNVNNRSPASRTPGVTPPFSQVGDRSPSAGTDGSRSNVTNPDNGFYNEAVLQNKHKTNEKHKMDKLGDDLLDKREREIITKNFIENIDASALKTRYLRSQLIEKPQDQMPDPRMVHLIMMQGIDPVRAQHLENMMAMEAKMKQTATFDFCQEDTHSAFFKATLRPGQTASIPNFRPFMRTLEEAMIGDLRETMDEPVWDTNVY